MLTKKIINNKLLSLILRSNISQESDPDFKGKVKVELTQENAQQIIDKWVKSNDICLFMKGTLNAPQCGYSNHVVQVLKKFGLTNYYTVNVLSDPIVRQQTKIYSKWPTFPQLYIKGNLVGGCDIVNEMHKDGSLQKLLNESKLL